MRNVKATSVFLFALVLISLAGSRAAHGQATTSRQENLEQLEAEFQKQYTDIEGLFLYRPAKKVFPPDPRERLRRWQDELADSFARTSICVSSVAFSRSLHLSYTNFGGY